MYPFLGVSVPPSLYSWSVRFLGANLGLSLPPVVDIDITLAVLLVRIREEEADALGVRGGWKIWDFAPETRGAEPLSRWGCEKLNAPGIAPLGEFVIL
jgi:hypothetical protein